MTSDDFVRKYLKIFTDSEYNEVCMLSVDHRLQSALIFVYCSLHFVQESVKLLAGIADTSKDGLISFAEFQAFEGLLCTPDALYKTAFQLFDRKGNGTVAYGEYVESIMANGLGQYNSL